MQRIEHSFVIRLHFAFQDRGSCYLVLDLKTGGDLRHYLKKRTLFEERDVAFYIACISSALNFIHSKNVIHRDVKPGELCLLDCMSSGRFFPLIFLFLSIVVVYREHYSGQPRISTSHRLWSSSHWFTNH